MALEYYTTILLNYFTTLVLYYFTSKLDYYTNLLLRLRRLRGGLRMVLGEVSRGLFEEVPEDGPWGGLPRMVGGGPEEVGMRFQKPWEVLEEHLEDGP